MLFQLQSYKLLSKLVAVSFSLVAVVLFQPVLAAEEKNESEQSRAKAEVLSAEEMEKEFALPLDNLEDIGYALQRVQQQAIDLYVEATRKKRESKVISKCLVIPREKLHPESYYQPLRKAWLVFFVGTMEPLVQLLVHDVQEVETHLSEVKIVRGKQKQFSHVYAQWHDAITGINRHLDVLSDQVDEAHPSNIVVANEAREIDLEIIRAMQLRLKAYAILSEAGPASKAK
ncbi:hypothetical protein BH11CYA1_BH11CYA1_13760 [soil metagenome]